MGADRAVAVGETVGVFLDHLLVVGVVGDPPDQVVTLRPRGNLPGEDVVVYPAALPRWEPRLPAGGQPVPGEVWQDAAGSLWMVVADRPEPRMIRAGDRRALAASVVNEDHGPIHRVWQPGPLPDAGEGM